MEKYLAAKEECADINETLRDAGKKIICNSLLLAANIIEKNGNVWNLVEEGIIDGNQNELVQSVGILLGIEKTKQKEKVRGETLADMLYFTFAGKYHALKKEDFEDIVCEYEAIREWLKDSGSEV
jgi:hypothetical protein